jgi:hypothetical protein
MTVRREMMLAYILFEIILVVPHNTPEYFEVESEFCEEGIKGATDIASTKDRIPCSSNK